MRYIRDMWDVEYTAEFGHWWDGLTGDEQESLVASVSLLRMIGPH